MQFYLIRDSLKMTKVTLVHKKNDPLDKDNYLPVSISFLFSEVYKRAIFDHISEHKPKFLDNFLWVL